MEANKIVAELSKVMPIRFGENYAKFEGQLLDGGEVSIHVSDTHVSVSLGCVNNVVLLSKKIDVVCFVYNKDYNEVNITCKEVVVHFELKKQKEEQ